MSPPQDILEEAIAKAVVLPSWLARPLHLKSVATRRRKLVAQLAGVVTDMWAGGASGEMGSWTAAIRTMDRSDLPGYHDLRAAAANSADGPENFTPEDAAEFMIGLLFASHKNPGIGAAQTLMFLLDPVHSAISAAVEKEVLGAASANVYVFTCLFLSSHFLRGFCECEHCFVLDFRTRACDVLFSAKYTGRANLRYGSMRSLASMQRLRTQETRFCTCPRLCLSHHVFIFFLV